VLARPRSSRRNEAFAAFSKAFGGQAPLTFQLFGDDVLRRANAINYGHDQLPTFDLARARYVMAFGADFLGTWNSPVAQNTAYGQMRQGRPGLRGKLVQVEARMSLTGASADEWVPVKPGTEGVLALGLAHVILKEKLRPGNAGRAAGLIDGWSGGLADYAPDKVAQITGVASKRVERLARELVEFRPSMAVIGGPPLAHTNGLFAAMAVNALNALLGADAEPGGVFFKPDYQPRAANPEPLRNLSAKVLLLDEANAVFASPKAWQVRETLAKIPYIASFGSFIDDTSSHADLILPDHSFLESWVDSTPESGSIEPLTTVAGPVMKPLHNTRATVDVLIEVAGKLKSPVVLPWKSAEELANSKSTDVARLSQGRDRGAESPALHKYAEPRFDGDAATYPFHFLPYASQAFNDGSAAHLPWLQEMPDPLTSAMWSSWVEINPQTAERLGVKQGDVIEVSSTQGTLRAPAMISPGIAPDIVAMPVGQGHESFTRFASGRGANPIAILAPLTESETGALAWAATRVKIARAGDDNGSLIMFAARCASIRTSTRHGRGWGLADGA
jgi:anaerobic selenocysteine-containing dehydrogenase